VTPLKILFISEYFPATNQLDIRGGMEARIYHLASAFARKHKIYVIASLEKGKPMEQLLQGMHVYRVGRPRYYTRIGGRIDRFIFMLFAIWKGFWVDFDIVEGSSFFGWLPALILSFAKRKKRVLVVADTVNNFVPVGGMEESLLQIYEKFILHFHWNKIICISHDVLNKIKRVVTSPKNTIIIYCGADIKSIRKIRTKKLKVFSISSVARLVSYKKLDVLIKAIKLVKSVIPEVRLDIIGDGEKYNDLLNLTQKLHLAKNTYFHRHVPNHKRVLKYIKQSTIFCLPSAVEGFGIVTIEACAAGVPVILANLPIHHEITKNGALFFRLDDEYDLAKKILELYKSTSLRNKLIKQVRSVAENYPWMKIIKKTEKVYEHMYSH